MRLGDSKFIFMFGPRLFSAVSLVYSASRDSSAAESNEIEPLSPSKLRSVWPHCYDHSDHIAKAP